MNGNDLLTPEEVVKMLRLEERKHPLDALKHLRRTGRIGFVRIGGRILYKREHIDEVINAGEQPRIEPVAAGLYHRAGRRCPSRGRR